MLVEVRMKKDTQNMKEKAADKMKPAQTAQKPVVLLQGLDNLGASRSTVVKEEPKKVDIWRVVPVMGGLTNSATPPSPTRASLEPKASETVSKPSAVVEKKPAKKQPAGSAEIPKKTLDKEPVKKEPVKKDIPEAKKDNMDAEKPKKSLKECVKKALVDGQPRTVSEVEKIVTLEYGKIAKVSLYTLFKDDTLFHKHEEASPAKYSLKAAVNDQITDAVTQANKKDLDVAEAAQSVDSPEEPVDQP